MDETEQPEQKKESVISLEERITQVWALLGGNDLRITLLVNSSNRKISIINVEAATGDDEG